jgi:hypothetical protein
MHCLETTGIRTEKKKERGIQNLTSCDVRLARDAVERSKVTWAGVCITINHITDTKSLVWGDHSPRKGRSVRSSEISIQDTRSLQLL